MAGRWKKGQSGNPKGRPGGVPNKVTTAFKSAVLNVFNENGGEEWFARWARRHPTEFFKIAARLIPLELVGRAELPVGPFELLSEQERYDVGRRVALLLKIAEQTMPVATIPKPAPVAQESEPALTGSTEMH